MIGGNRISVDSLQSQVNLALSNANAITQLGGPNKSRPVAVRAVLSRIIQGDLIEKVAAARHVTLSAGDVAAETQVFIQNNGGSPSALEAAAASAGFSKSQLTDKIRQQALVDKLETALTANLTPTPAELQNQYAQEIDQFDQVKIAEIGVASKTTAQTVLARARAHPASFGQLARQYSQDQTASNGGNVGYIGRSQVIQELGQGVAAVKPGSIVMVKGPGGYLIIHVIKRRVQPITAVEDQLKAAIFSQQAPQLLATAVQKESATLGVHISPRYGTWDAKNQAVAVTKSSTDLAS